MRTAFGKTFTYYIIILLVSFFLLSLGFTEIFRGYFYDDQKNDLLNQAIKISDIYTQSHSDDGFDENYFKNEIGILDKYMDYSFFMTNKELIVLTKSKDINTIEEGSQISAFYGYKDVIDGNVQWLQGDIDNTYQQNKYILCYPTLYNGEVSGIVFVSVPLSELTGYINRVYVIIAFFLVLSIILGFVTIHWAVSEFVMPIRRLSAVAKYISMGNFEERIETSNNTNDEMAELCNSFNTMAESLSNLDKRRREILSNISHDVRSPITLIKGFLQAMLDGVIGEEKYEHYLKIIFNETNRLQKLTEGILDLNKLDDSENAITKINFDMNVVIDETLKLMKVKAMAANIELIEVFEEEKLIVHADVDKIRRVMTNLVDNAIKFTNEGSITVSSKIRDNKAYISVEDTGVGLTEEEQARVFERLYKVDKSRGMTGSGLGLSIVKEFIKAHNQTIELESEKDRGSKFTFTLDLKE